MNTVGFAKTKRRRLTSAREIDGDPVGRDALVHSMPTWRGPNELRGEPRHCSGAVLVERGERERSEMDDRSLARSRRKSERERERKTEEVKEGNQARRRREGHAL